MCEESFSKGYCLKKHMSCVQNENGISIQLLCTYVYNSCFSKARLEKKTLCIVSWEKIDINSSIFC